MDELDRLFHRLVRNIRSGFPELETRLFEVSKIYHEIVPYRTNRRQLGFETNDEYELALLQLLAGTRGLLHGDAEMQQALKRELESPNPELSAYRAFGTSLVSLSAEAARRVQTALTPDATEGQPTPGRSLGENARQSFEAARAAARPTESIGTPTGGYPPTASASVLAPAPVSSAPSESSRSADGSSVPLSQRVAELSMPIGRPTPIKTASGEKCRYCSGALPDGRAVVFCPSCGHNLTVQHCPACNTELEAGWKFCITCGRDTR
jgi:hypothetical protein